MASEPEQRTEEEEVEDPNAITSLEIAGFLLRAARRHLALGLLLGLSLAVIGVTVVGYIPSQYETHSKILIAQAASVESALSNPNRQMPNVDVLGGAPELLMQKSNLTWIVQEADMLARWKATRPLPMRIKDSAVALVAGEPTEADLVDALVKMLEQKMSVTRDNAILQIHVVWNDPDLVAKIATLAQNRFLELRRTQEMSVITSAISILEDEAKRSGDAIDPALQDVVKAMSTARALQAGPAASPAGPGAPGAPAAAPAPVAAGPRKVDGKIPEKLATIRQQLKDAEAPHQRRLADLKMQLIELRASLGPAHPSVVGQEAKIREASVPPPEVTALRNEEQALLAQLESSPYGDDAPSQALVPRLPAAPAVGAPSTSSRDDDRERDEDPNVTASRARLKSAIDHYADLNKRLDSARLELITAQSAFRHKYIVVAEPERPRKPFKPKRALLLAGALFASAAIGLLAGALKELLTGRVIEPWQLKPHGLPVLGELRLPPKRDL